MNNENEKKMNEEIEDEKGSVDESDLLNDLSFLGQQVSQFMEETKEYDDTEEQVNHELVATDEMMNGIDEPKEVKQPIEKIEESEDEESSFAQQVTENNLGQTYGEVQDNIGDQEIIHNQESELFLNQEPELESINDSLAQQIEKAIDEDEAFRKHLAKRKKRKVLIIVACVFLAFIASIAVLLGTRAGKKVVVQTVAPIIYDDLFTYDDNEQQEVNEPSNRNENTMGDTEIRNQDDVVNILLIGVEEIEGAENTDAMIIASMNRTTDELSIISLMRDLYVKIPGHNDNKLNAAYALGGIRLLYDTLELNFGVHMDGYMLVNFKAFETIVDLLGGVEVTLTQNEANYLNTKNYISNPANRRVVAGRQIMNGNQALGYCRVRYVSTGKESNDFGRTARQRAVLNSMFEQLKRKNVFQLISFMNDVFESVQLKTDISKGKFSDYLTEVVDLNLSQLEQHRIPEDDQYTDDKVYIGKHKQWVLLAKDWNEIKDTMKEYIYGKDANEIEE